MVEPMLLWIPLIAGLIALAFYWQWKRDQERTAAFKALARKRGWRYTDKDRRTDDRYEGFEPFSEGHSRYGRWLVEGEHEGVAFQAFTYHYAVTHHTGKTSHTEDHWHRCCAIEMPIRAPNLVLRDEHLGHKLWDAVGGEDIDVESQAFSDKYWVRCENRKFAYDVLHGPMIEYLLDLEGWVWQWRGDRLLVYDEAGKMEATDVDDLLDLVLGFRERLPRHLLAAAE